MLRMPDFDFVETLLILFVSPLPPGVQTPTVRLQKCTLKSHPEKSHCARKPSGRYAPVKSLKVKEIRAMGGGGDRGKEILQGPHRPLTHIHSNGRATKGPHRSLTHIPSNLKATMGPYRSSIHILSNGRAPKRPRRILTHIPSNI